MDCDATSPIEGNAIIISVVFIPDVQRELRLSLLKMLRVELALLEPSPDGRFSPLLTTSHTLIHAVTSYKYGLVSHLCDSCSSSETAVARASVAEPSLSMLLLSWSLIRAQTI